MQQVESSAVQIKRGKMIPGLGFTLLVAASFSLFFIPAFIIQPFRYQSPHGLVWAMTLRQHAPFWTAVFTAGAIVLAIVLWHRFSVWKRVALVLGLCLACAAAVMSRIDYFEWMFHPVPALGFESGDHAKLDSSEMVIAVRFGNDARAYPIREMAYHHVVNDVVGGVPIAVTY
jgi:hypothetical protein